MPASPALPTELRPPAAEGRADTDARRAASLLSAAASRPLSAVGSRGVAAATASSPAAAGAAAAPSTASSTSTTSTAAMRARSRCSRGFTCFPLASPESEVDDSRDSALDEAASDERPGAEAPATAAAPCCGTAAASIVASMAAPQAATQRENWYSGPIARCMQRALHNWLRRSQVQRGQCHPALPAKSQAPPLRLHASAQSSWTNTRHTAPRTCCVSVQGGTGIMWSAPNEWNAPISACADGGFRTRQNA
jgi:hypothetical protein